MAKPPSSGLPWVIAQVVLWMVQLSFPFWGNAIGVPIPSWGSPFEGWELVAAGILGVAGAWLAAASIHALGTNLTALPRPKDDSVLVVRGPYRRLRHPIYSALVLLFFGWALVWKHPVLVGLVFGLSLLFFFKSRLEERWLLSRYPEYLAYRKRTGGLVPRFFR